MYGLSAPFASILDFVLPRRCASCGIIVGQTGSFCLTCWNNIQYLTGKGCLRCNTPVVRGDQVCAPCLAKPPSHDGVQAAVIYDDISSGLAIRLKHSRRIGLAKVMAEAMANRVEDQTALLVPVPLHRLRIWRRGFNQSALIAKSVARCTNLDLALDILERPKATPLLGNLSATNRAKALQGAIKVRSDKRSLLRDRHIYLVDDVYTSGATANACARVLKRAGAARVTVLCWARVLKEEG